MKIRLQTIKDMAPRYFNEVRRHIMAMKSMRGFIGNHSEMNPMIERFVSMSGLSTADLMLPYDEWLIDYDGFRMCIILYTCACMVSQRDRLSMEEYRGFIETFQRSLSSDYNPNDLIQYFSKNIDIDQSLIPAYVKINIAKESEERNAEHICEKYISKIRYPEVGETYDSYKSYVEERSAELLSNLNKEGFINTYPVETFSVMVMLKKMGMQTDKLYRVDAIPQVPKEVLHAISRKIFEFKASGGGIIGNLGDVDS